MEPIDKLALTDKQAKAFLALKKAYKDCLSAGIHFETLGEKLIPLNRKHIVSVRESDESGGNDVDLSFVMNGSIDVPASWIDCGVIVTVKG